MIDCVESKDYKRLDLILNDQIFSKQYDFEHGTASEAFVRACTLGDLYCMDVLLARKADPNAFSGKPLHKAASRKVEVRAVDIRDKLDSKLNATTVKARQMDPKQRQLEAKAKLDEAKREREIDEQVRNQVEVVRKLVHAGANPNARSVWAEFTALHFACAGGNYGIVEALVELGCDINQTTHESRCRSENGWTPLHFACDRGHLSIVQYLVRMGAAVDVPSASGDVSSFISYLWRDFNHRVGVVNVSSASRDDGASSCLPYLVIPSCIAHSLSHVDFPSLSPSHAIVLSPLLSPLFPVFPSLSWQTACSLAAEHGHADIVKFLIWSGARIDAKRRGLSLVQWAIYRADCEMIDFLVSYGAEVDLDTKVLWFPEDKPPVFGQWNFEDQDEEVVKLDKLSKIQRRQAAEQEMKNCIERAARQRVLDNFNGDVYEDAAQAEKALESAMTIAVTAALAQTEELEAKKEQDAAAVQAKVAALALVPPHSEDKKRGYLSLRDVIRRDFSAVIYERICAAIYQGNVRLRERVAHQHILSLFRWESSTTTSDGLSLETQVQALPMEIIHIILSYEM